MLFFCTFAVAMRKKLYLYTLYSLFLLASCADKKPQQELTPWGTPVGEVESMDGSDEEESDETQQMAMLALRLSNGVCRCRISRTMAS